MKVHVVIGFMFETFVDYAPAAEVCNYWFGLFVKLWFYKAIDNESPGG